MLDALKPITHKRLIEHELEGFGIRLNKEPPKITFKKKERGGVSFASTVQTTHLDLETVTAILKECAERCLFVLHMFSYFFAVFRYRINSADVRLQGDYTDEDLIDVIEGNRIYIPAIYVCNKIDQISLEELELLDKMPHYCPVSAHAMWNMDGLLEMMWEYLDLVRIYTKPRGLNPDYSDPVVMNRKNSTVEDFCNRIHKGLLRQLKARERESVGARTCSDLQSSVVCFWELALTCDPIAVCARVGNEREAPAAKGWKGTPVGRRGRDPAGEARVTRSTACHRRPVSGHFDLCSATFSS